MEYREAITEQFDTSSLTLEVSVCSDTPYLRSFGYETLSIMDCDLSWVSSGNAPVLLDHKSDDITQHIGVVQKAWVDETKVRVLIKFSEDETKQGIVKDILTGIRGNFSIGYSITQKTLIGKIGNTDNYKCNFTIYEVSSVAIPADINVGIGRNNNQFKEENKMEDNQKQDFNKRYDDIEVLCKKFKMEEKIGEFVKSDMDLLSIREAVLAEVEARSSLIPPVAMPVDIVKMGAPAVHIKKNRSFSTANAILGASTGNWKGAEYEYDESQRAAQINNVVMNPTSVYIDVNSRASNTVGGTGFGAELVGNEFAPGGRWIDLLISKTICDRLGVDMSLTGLTQNVSIPRYKTGISTSWGAETASLGTASAMGTDKINLDPHRLTAKAQFSRQLLTQGLPNIDARIEQDIMERIALAVDTALIHGTGTTNQPLGLLNVPDLQIVPLDTNGSSTITWAQVNSLMSNVEQQNAAMNGDKGKFLSNSKVTNKLRTTLIDTNTAALYLLKENNMLVGCDYVDSNIIRKDLVKGTSGAVCSPLVYGCWSEAYIAQWGAIELVTDPHTAADINEIVIRAYSYWDIDFKHVEAFSAIVDLIA